MTTIIGSTKVGLVTLENGKCMVAGGDVLPTTLGLLCEGTEGLGARILLLVPGIHPKTAALFSYLLGTDPVTLPFITSHAVTSDGFVMVGTNMDMALNELFGEVGYLEQKVQDLLDHAVANGLVSQEDANAAMKLARTRMAANSWYPGHRK